MKRRIVLIVMLLLLVDLAEDGHLGNAKSGPLQAAVSNVLSQFPQHPSRAVDFFNLLPSSEWWDIWLDIFSSEQAEPVIPIARLALKVITSCNNGGSGGLPR